MKKGVSHGSFTIKNDHTTSLPKLQKVSPVKNRSTSLANLLNKQKRNKDILKQIKPVKQVLPSDDESDTEEIIQKLTTPTKKASMAQLVVLNLNKNKKDRPKVRFTKQVFVGEEAVKKFYDRYKNIEKFKEITNFQRIQDPLTKIVSLLEVHGFAPRKLDVIKLKGSHAILNLRKLGLGQGKLGQVVTDLMNYIANFQCVDLSYNMIDKSLSETLIEQLGRVKIINLSHNRIGKAGCDKFTELFFASKTKIQELYLEDNNLLDNAGVSLIMNLVDYGNLRVLNLSKNFLGNRFAVSAKQYLMKDNCLEELYLSWNEIGDKGTKMIFESLEKNSVLKVFDYSWNQIGIFSTSALAKTIKNNDTLLHVDIAFCEIQKKQAKEIAKALEDNHTIYGFHFQGNSGFINNKGYLQLTEKEHHEYPLPIVKGLLRQIDSIRSNSIQNEFRSFHMRDVCWICEGWQEVIFKIKKPNNTISQCFLHLQHEKFDGIKMQESEEFYEVYRMCPIKKVQFFFTFSYGPGNKEHLPMQDYPIVDYEKQINFKIGKIKLREMIGRINVIKVDYNQDPIDENYYPTVHCLPRSQEVAVIFSQKQQIKIRQVKKVVVKKKRKVIKEEKLQMKFREFNEGDANEFLKNYDERHDKDYYRCCLEFDIANSKILKLIKNPDDLEAFKEMMTTLYYRSFKDVFYYLASSYPSATGVFSISQFEFEKFIEEQRYISKRVTHAKIILKMYSCLSSTEDETSVQKKSGENFRLFSRPQFLEFLIRLALEKWCPLMPKKKKKKEEEQKKEEKKEEQDEDEIQKKQKLKLPLPLLEGLEKTMKSLPKYADRNNATIWRKSKYLLIDIHVVLKGYETFLMSLFDKYANGQRKIDKPKKLRGLITLDELKAIFVETDIKKTKQGTKDLEKPFLDSVKLPLEDGIIQFGLNYEQFCQCLARYSQILWFPPIASEKNELWEFQYNRRNLPLFIRFQSLIVNIYRRHIPFHTRRMNILTQKGLFVQETEVLLQKIKEMDIGAKTDLGFKINKMEDDEAITLKGLVQALKEKYENVVIRKQEQIEEEQEQQELI